MKPRIFGIETEYGITCASTVGGQPPMDAEGAAQRLFAGVLADARATNTFLTNGSRLYLDVGAHPEYASAECTTLAELIATDRAGDEIFSRMAQEANQQLASEGINGEIHLFKNNLDSEGNSFGCHENYLIHRARDFRHRIEGLIPFFVTRQILVGAGFVNVRAEGGARYEISPRAGQMWDAVSSATTRTRPMINTRDEPHGDPERFRRMHVIVGDSNMSQATLALKIGMTEAVLNVIEESKGELPDFALADPTQAIRDISAQLDGKALVELASGGSATALDIQQAIHEYVFGIYERNGWLAELDPIQSYAFDLWDRALCALEHGNREAVATEIDWVAKERLLNTYCERSGLSLDDPRISRIELAWHDVTPAGLRAKLEATGALRTVVMRDAVTTAQTVPPQTTRAKLRGEFVAAARAAGRDYMVDWTNVRLLADSGSTNVLLDDPFTVSDERVDELLEEVCTGGL